MGTRKLAPGALSSGGRGGGNDHVLVKNICSGAISLPRQGHTHLGDGIIQVQEGPVCLASF